MNQLLFILLFIQFAIFGTFCEENFITKCEIENGLNGICVKLEDCAFDGAIIIRDSSSTCDSGYVCCDKNPHTSNQFTTKILDSTECFSGGYDGQTFSTASKDNLKYEITELNANKPENKVTNFLVKIGYREFNGDVRYFCGGILITPTYVLTSAHCTNFKGTSAEVVELGNLSINKEKIPIIKIYTHPNYSDSDMYHDIAVMELAIETNFLPACFWKWNEENIFNSTKMFAFGHNFINTDEMIVMSVDIMPTKYCNDFYLHARKLSNGMSPTQYCVGNTNLTDSQMCKGLIGGPLMARNAQNEFYLIGLATYVQQCYSKVYPIIYLKLIPYMKWLRSIIV
ncbi:serine protease snake-like [Teleopsis dalmanni]|uniref:serine protease snake-like n=1 Tax=Teleopsis dalmanni TaxID=139649 RepID=UPI0018CE62CC|nr:serine protease snake-like [Teleopsis dalmanni]